MEEIKINLPEFNLDELRDDGTDIGTFKSVKTLKDAYDTLRACFTKNAMELARVKKENASQNLPKNADEERGTSADKRQEILNKNDEIVYKSTEIKGQNAQNTNKSVEIVNESAENAENQPQNTENEEKPVLSTEVCAKTDQKDENNPENAKESDNTAFLNALRTKIFSGNGEQVDNKAAPLSAHFTESSDKAPAPERIDEFSKDNAEWTLKVEKFFTLNPSAREHSNEIAKILVQDKAVRESESPLMSAWVRVLENNSKNYELTDDFIEKNILSNPKIRERVIREYLKDVKTSKSAPPLIATRLPATTQVSVRKKIENMAQAREAAKKLFK